MAPGRNAALQGAAGAYRVFPKLGDRLAALPGVQRLTSTLVMKDIVDRGLPI